jgi:hypothetical protein
MDAFAMQLKVGQQVRLLRECWYWPTDLGRAPVGTTGTVEFDDGPCIGVKLDEPIKGAESNDIIYWHVDGIPNNYDDIMKDLEVIE